MNHSLGVANSLGKQVVPETRKMQVRSGRNQVPGNDHRTRQGEDGSQESRNHSALANSSKQERTTTIPWLYELLLKIH